MQRSRASGLSSTDRPPILEPSQIKLLPNCAVVEVSNSAFLWGLTASLGNIVVRKGNPSTVAWVHRDFFPIETTFQVISRDTDGDQFLGRP